MCTMLCKQVSPSQESISTSFSLRLGVDFTAAEKRIPTRPKHPLLSIFTLLFILYTYSDTAYTVCALSLKVCNSVSHVYFHTFDCWWLIPVHYTKAIQYVKKRMRVPSMMAIMLPKCHHPHHVPSKNSFTRHHFRFLIHSGLGQLATGSLYPFCVYKSKSKLSTVF